MLEGQETIKLESNGSAHNSYFIAIDKRSVISRNNELMVFNGRDFGKSSYNWKQRDVGQRVVVRFGDH